MIANVNEFLGTVAQTELAKAARRSARTIWNAHRAALDTTRHEAGKVFGLALSEGQKFNARGRDAIDSVAGELAGSAGERMSSLEKAMQKRVTNVIRRIGLPTANEVEALSRRVDALSVKVKPRATRKPARRARRRAA